MVNEKILNSYTVAELKKEISKRNIKGYSKMKRPELHALISKHKKHFSDLSEKVKTAKSAPKPPKPKASKPKAEPKKKVAEKPKPKPKPKPTPKPSNKQSLPLGAAMKVKELLVDKRDLVKRNIKVSDSSYFYDKVMKLLKQKDEYKYNMGSEPARIKNVVEAIIRHDANAKKGEQLLMKEDTLGGKALGLVKRLTKNVKPNLSDEDEPMPTNRFGSGNEAIAFLTGEHYMDWWYNSDRYFGKGRKKSVLMGPEKYGDSKTVKQVGEEKDTKKNTTLGTPEYYDRLFARNKGKDIFDMPAGILTYEAKPRGFK